MGAGVEESGGERRLTFQGVPQSLLIADDCSPRFSGPRGYGPHFRCTSLAQNVMAYDDIRPPVSVSKGAWSTLWRSDLSR